MFSYAGELRLGVSADAHLVPDPSETRERLGGLQLHHEVESRVDSER